MGRSVRAKSYALLLAAVAVTMFLGVAAANVAIDPWRVFGLTPIPPSNNVNDRYERFRAYEAAPDRYDGLLLSSSRGRIMRIGDLRRGMGMDLADFSVSYGRLEDHLAVLDFVLRDKAARGKRLKAVFLLIDVDTLGERPPVAGALQLLQPPAISSDVPLRFWWKNLIAIQWAAWIRTLREPRFATSDDTRWPERGMQQLPAKPPLDAAMSEHILARPRYADDMRNWSRIAALCRDNGATLIAVLSPIAPRVLALLDAEEISTVAEQISRSAPVWNFSGKAEPSNRPELWFDDLHFVPVVPDMMVRRIFGDEVPAEWAHFGRLLGR